MIILKLRVKMGQATVVYSDSLITMKKIFMPTSLTCTVSDYDASLVLEFFKKNGFSMTSDPGKAVIILINTCGSDTYREKKSFELINFYVSRFSEQKKIVIFGCMVNQKNDILENIRNVTLIGPKELNKFNYVINKKISINEVNTNRVMKLKQIDDWERGYPSDTFVISISRGCMGECSYCVIKRARGPLTSKPLNEILEEFRKGLGLGYKKYALIGNDVGCYGMDVGTDITVLLDHMCKEEGEYKIMLHYFDPKWLVKLYPKLKEILKLNKISSINLPVQSGSNKILKLMRRGYNIEDVIRIISEIKRMCKIYLATDVIFGFPTETREQFMRSIKIAELFDEVNFYAFSSMLDTDASKLEPKVPKKELKEMIKVISKLRSRDPKKFMMGYLGYGLT